MIWLGLDDAAKADVVARFRAERDIRKMFVLSPKRFAPSFAPEQMTAPETQCDGRDGLFIDWPDLIQYRFYYRLLQQIDASTLVVVNECLRTQNRHDLTYNCVRNYLNQTPHVLVFQYLPIIDMAADMMTLFDFVTRSRWKREPFDAELVRREAHVHVEPAAPALHAIRFEAPASTHAAYARERAALFDAVRADPEKDPHVIPRNLLLVSGKAKLPHVDAARRYAGRNNRFKLAGLDTWREVATPEPRVAFELPHNFGELADALAVTRQRTLDVLVSDTKADRWYFDRFAAWAERVRNVTAALHG